MLTWGVDTLWLTFLAPVDERMIARLAKAKEEARAKREASSSEPTIVEIAGAEWRLSPSSAPPYKFVLSRPDEMDVRVAGRRLLSSGTPTVVIELRSEFLWRGWADAADAAERLAEAILGSPVECLEAVARIDLCADFQGWEPTGTDDELRRFVRRTRKNVDRHGADDTFTGYSLGLGAPFQARLYDKSEEIARTGKMWFHDLWASAGYDKEAPVWRLEMQARTEALDEMGLRVDWSRNVRPRLDELWRYAFGDPEWTPERESEASIAVRYERSQVKKGRGSAARLAVKEWEVEQEQRRQGAWLSLRVPSPQSRAEWPIDPAWRELQRVVFVDAGAHRAHREQQRAAQLENIRQQLAGLLASYGALAGLTPRGGDGKYEANDIALTDVLIRLKRHQLDADRIEPRDFRARLSEKQAARDPVFADTRTPMPPALAPWLGKSHRYKDHPFAPPQAEEGPHPIDDRVMLWNKAHANYRSARSLAPPSQPFLPSLTPAELAAEAEDRAALAEAEREARRSIRWGRARKWGDQ